MSHIARLSSRGRLLWSRLKLVATRARLVFVRLAGQRDVDAQVDWKTVRAPLADNDVVLLSPTHLWLHDLSRAVHPVQLCRHHPRVANRIAKAWHDPKRAERLLHDLIFDRRQIRRGFPPRIAHEIDRLYRYNAGRLNPLLRPQTTAGAPAQARAARQVVAAPAQVVQPQRRQPT